MNDTEGNTKDIDEKLHARLTEQKDIRQFIAKFYETIQLTCKKTCNHLNRPNLKIKDRSIPWGTDALKIMRKKTNALRRLHQRTKNNNELREGRKNQYTKAKTVPSRHKERENKLMETTLYNNLAVQPMERGIQTCLRQNKEQGNDYNTAKT